MEDSSLRNKTHINNQDLNYIIRFNPRLEICVIRVP